MVRLSLLFLKQVSGNISVLFALALLPLALAVGLSIEYSNTAMSKQKLQGLLDTALLYIAHDSLDMTDSQLTVEAKRIVYSHLSANEQLQNIDVEVTRAGKVLTGHSNADLPTSILRLTRIYLIPINVYSTVTFQGKKMEIALVLDSTGSMHSDMGNLRTAVLGFIDHMQMINEDDNVSMAVVPYVGSVNIGNQPLMEAWLDKAGASQHAAQSLRNKIIGIKDAPECVGRSVKDPIPAHNVVVQQPATGPYLPVVVGCYYLNPPQISNWRLFENLSNVKWGGCVEARPEPYDIDDTPPNSANPNTLWHPFFFIDAADDGPDENGQIYTGFDNSYLPDYIIPGTKMATTTFGRNVSVMKYRNQAVANLDEIPPSVNGPNRNCPDPILPLTNNFTTLKNKIQTLNYRTKGGTNTGDGLAWGMRVLSPGVPFTEGKPYGQVEKVIVLFTDGDNRIGDFSTDVPLLSEYTSYGFAKGGRYPLETFSDGGKYLDARMMASCTLNKSHGTQIFIVGYRVNAAIIKQFEECAGSAENVKLAGNAEELRLAFIQFSRQIAKIRITH